MLFNSKKVKFVKQTKTYIQSFHLRSKHADLTTKREFYCIQRIFFQQFIMFYQYGGRLVTAHLRPAKKQTLLATKQISENLVFKLKLIYGY